MNTKEAKEMLQRIANRNSDVELEEYGGLYRMIINGHLKGWIKSEWKKPKDLMHWIEGVNCVLPVFEIFG